MVSITGETFQVYFLGTAGALPTPNRNPSCIMVKRGSDTILLDCGEGVQQQMMRARTGFSVDAIFITHWHADHFLGIFGLLQSLSFMGRTASLPVYGPEGCHEFISLVRQFFKYNIRFSIQSIHVSSGSVIRFNGYSIYVISTQHGTQSVGYIVSEDPRPGKFNRDRAIELSVEPGPLFGRLQRGETVKILRNGILVDVHPNDVMGPPRPGRKIVYTGDTRPIPMLCGDIAYDADLLIHDATFDDSELERAMDVYHSTAGEAGDTAHILRARSLALVHISSRYASTISHIKDAKKQFNGEVIAPADLTMISIPFKE